MVYLGPEQPQTFNIPGYSPGLFVLCPWPISQNIGEPQYTGATAKVLPYELEGRKTTVRVVYTQGLRRIFSDSKNNEGQEDSVTKPAGGAPGQAGERVSILSATSVHYSSSPVSHHPPFMCLTQPVHLDVMQQLLRTQACSSESASVSQLLPLSWVP